MSDLTLDELNDRDEAAFVDELGGVYEHSPWVARRSYPESPFESVADLHETMADTVRTATREEKLALLRAHPDLGDRTEMTDASEEEQASAGLDDLSREQYEAFQRLNDRYRDKFGFPFIMAVKDETPAAIRAAMEERVENDEETEFQTALDEVHQIARFRLDDMLTA